MKCYRENCRWHSFVGREKCGIIPATSTNCMENGKYFALSVQSVDVECQRCGETYIVEPYTPGQDYICLCGAEYKI